MGRYRPPQQLGSKYITPVGYQRLVDELDNLWKKKRPEVTRALADAAAEGDRSENAEYIYRKKELGGIDRRIRFLRKRLEGMNVVRHIPTDKTMVYFGAWVRIENEEGLQSEYRIVGPDETDAEKGWISMDSPMGKALMRKSIDDEVFVKIFQDEICYAILNIRY